MTRRVSEKCWPDFFQKILEGEKTCELRLADWECKPGDVLVLREWNPKTGQYTGRELEKTVTHVAKTRNMKFFAKEYIDKYGFQAISFR
jgi:hypothetical protein